MVLTTMENNLSMTMEKWIRYHQSIIFKQEYKGLQMIKNPLDLTVYEEILWRIKPTVIIEIGSKQGGFTLWLKDHAQIMKLNAKIISIDLTTNARQNLDVMKDIGNNLICLVGNCNSPEILSELKRYILKNDIVLAIEDSSHTFDNTLRVLENYKEIVTVGSYLIVEDGICDVLNIRPVPGPMKAIEKWILNNPNYVIERGWEKYIVTYNPKGYLKRLR